MKVIFLDFDGVMNSQSWLLKNMDGIKASTSLLERGAQELDPFLVQRVLEVIEATGAAVVISSSWRRLHTLEEIKLILAGTGFPEFGQHIIDRTPFSREIEQFGIPEYGVQRGHEIDFWIKRFEEKNGRLDAFVIIDDDSDMLSEQRSFFVHTNWDHGIQPEHVAQAIQILGTQSVQV